jgi:RNA polymerase sigma-70 factor (ECF subfamily)
VTKQGTDRRGPADESADHPADDAALLRAHVDGDGEAFGFLVRRHRDRLWAVALRTLGDREEAADALQDALVSALRAAKGFRGDSAVTTWLHRIVVNACLDRIRRRQVRPTVPLPDEGPGEPAAPGDPMAERETALMVREALATLPAEQRAALVLTEMQGHSVAEVAVMLGVAEGTVKSRCARARARLALALGHLRPLPGEPGQEGNQGSGARVRPENAAEHERHHSRRREQQ